jgi:1-phosphatidylinositol-4-phosphate 5-kinase
MKKAETRFLRRILPHYYEHVRKNPDTLLVRFCGMYRVKASHFNTFP